MESTIFGWLASLFILFLDFIDIFLKLHKLQYHLKQKKQAFQQMNQFNFAAS
jgi:hypothetical protein